MNCCKAKSVQLNTHLHLFAHDTVRPNVVCAQPAI